MASLRCACTDLGDPWGILKKKAINFSTAFSLLTIGKELILLTHAQLVAVAFLHHVAAGSSLLAHALENCP
jgi:hypothetical protein